jgi:hypothetical protein
MPVWYQNQAVPAAGLAYLSNACNFQEFFIIPKSPTTSGIINKERYWRLDFHEEERALLDNEFTIQTCVKPIIKLLKVGNVDSVRFTKNR